MKARQPIPRTEEEREERRAKQAKSTASLSNDVPEVVVDALLHARPALLAEPRQVQQGLAYVYWISANKGRRHNQHPDCFSVNHIELEVRFGREGFERLNAGHDLFVTPGKHRPGSTKPYRWTVAFNDAMQAYLHHFNRDVGVTTRLVQPDGTIVRNVPRVSGANEKRLRTTPLTGDCSVLEYAPVDLYALSRLDVVLAQAQGAEGRERVTLLDSLDLDATAKLASLREVMSRVLVAARIDTFGCGRMQHRYEQCGTGRFFATGTNLQSAPNIIKRVALHGLWQYDFANCHLTILYQLADRAGIACPTLLHYLQNKRPVREGVAARVGISVEQAKTCLLKVTYGAKASMRSVDAIPKEIGAAHARIFYRDPFVTALKKELVAVRDALLATWPQEDGVILNALGLACSAKARPAERLAHILQGIEAQALLAAVGSLPGQIVLLEHDGFVTRNPVDVLAAERVVRDATGFELTLEESRLSLPRGIDRNPQDARHSLRNSGCSSPFATDSRSFSAKITGGCVL